MRTGTTCCGWQPRSEPGPSRASLMLRRLGSYPRQNGLGPGTARDRPDRADAVHLDWLETPAAPAAGYRRAQQGRSPERAGPRRLLPASAGCVTAGAEAQQHRASGLNLVAAAIVLWNTVYLGRAWKRCAAGARPCRRLARPFRPARLAAHQPHRRLSLGPTAAPGR